MVRVIRGHGRWVRQLIGVADQYSVDLANTMAMSTATISPMSRGAGGANNQGLPGAGVNAHDVMTQPFQEFQGMHAPLVHPRGKIGDSLAGSLPGSADSSGPVAWMDMRHAVGTGYGS